MHMSMPLSTTSADSTLPSAYFVKVETNILPYLYAAFQQRDTVYEGCISVSIRGVLSVIYTVIGRPMTYSQRYQQTHRFHRWLSNNVLLFCLYAVRVYTLKQTAKVVSIHTL